MTVACIISGMVVKGLISNAGCRSLRVLALLSGPSASGNSTTIRRIASHLASSGHSVVLLPAPDDHGQLSLLAREHEIDVLIGTHALHSGAPFLEAGRLPYVLVLGGTDVNEYALDQECLTVMTKAVDRAAAVIAFNDDFMRRGVALWPQISEKLYRIPQSAATRPSRFSLLRSLGLEPDAKIFLLPSGLRPVKDPFFLFKSISEWHEEDPRVRLVIAGVSYEPEFTDMVKRRCASQPGIDYIGTLTQPDLHAAMLQATAVLNTSLSECSPNALLEAMALGRPVVVRDIPGNTCLVEHDVTGLVFGTPDGFRQQAQRLVDDELLGRRLARRGRERVRLAHGSGAERAAYADVFRRIAENLPPASQERTVHVNGAELRVETFGRPADPAILLIAGASASMLAWDAEFCRRLAAGARFVIRYDHRDTGRSTSYAPGAPPYTLRDLTADAIGVLDGLGCRTAHLVGISMGGMIAQLAALDHPERVASLALLATSPGGGSPRNPDLPAPSPQVAFELDDLPEPDWDDRSAVVDHLVAIERLLASRSRPFGETDRRDLAGRVFDRCPSVLPSGVNHLLMDHGEPWRHRLGDVRAATLVVHGAEDPIYPLAHGHALASEISEAGLLVLDRAGHELAPADWETLIRALAEHTGPARLGQVVETARPA